MNRNNRRGLGGFGVAAMLCIASAGGSAQAEILDFRTWLDANGMSTNVATNTWQGRRVDAAGALMAAGASWTSPGFLHSTPLIGPLTSPGSDNGAAGPATFNGAWVHPGSGVAAVAVFAPQSPVWAGGMSVRWEYIFNGLSGNGVRATVQATISGVTTTLGSPVLLAGTTDVTSNFLMPSTVLMQPGDTLAVIFDDNGSYLFDHVNFNATVIIPAPPTCAALLGAMVIGRRRRR